jgi:hypothetical protein
VRGHCHDYLAMELDFSRPGVLEVDMRTKYVKSMVTISRLIFMKGSFFLCILASNRTQISTCY